MQFEAQLSSYSAFPAMMSSCSTDEFRIVDIGMVPRMQNAGVVTTLIQRLQAEAQQAKLPIRATVSRSNPGSLRVHERLGFKIVGESLFDLYLEWTPSSRP
jgi:RimJ/RimL family protein N-acetyltransferase